MYRIKEITQTNLLKLYLLSFSETSRSLERNEEALMSPKNDSF